MHETDWDVVLMDPEKPKCARCGRPFTPKGDEIWGPKCAKKMHDQLFLEVRDEKGEVTAVIL